MHRHVVSLVLRRPHACRRGGALRLTNLRQGWRPEHETSPWFLSAHCFNSFHLYRGLTSLPSASWNANQNAASELDSTPSSAVRAVSSQPKTVVRTVVATSAVPPTIPHPWIAAALVDLESSPPSALYQQAHRLLDALEQAALAATASRPNASFVWSPEQWMEAEDCLWSLSNARNTESIDLTFLLLDKLLLARHALYGLPTETPLPSSHEAHSSFVTNWELWHSILMNWQQVCKEYLTPHDGALRRNSTTHALVDMDAQIVPPAKLLVMLDGWNTLLATFPRANAGPWHSLDDADASPHFTCVTSKTLSLLIDVTGRRGRFLATRVHGPSAGGPVASGRTDDTLLAHAELGESLLLRMMEHADSNVGSFPPSASNLNMILNLWSKLGDGDRAWHLLHRVQPMIRPDLVSYNTVLHAYAVVGQGAAAERVLADMCRPSSSSASGSSASPVMAPNVTTWNIVLAAWARSTHKVAAAQRVEQMLVTMVKSGDMASTRSTVQSTNAAGTIVAPDHRVAQNVSDASTPLQDDISTEHLLHSVVKPNLTTFNTALSAWARVGEAETCARLLGEMRDLYEAGRLDEAPDSFSYATVLNAFAKAGEPDQAETLFDQMYVAYTQHGMMQLKPTIPILTTILDAYSRKVANAVAKKDDAVALHAVQRAQSILQRMKDLNQAGFLTSGPDTPAYNVMLTCYLRSASVSTFPRVNASADLADKLLQEMKQMAAWNDTKAAPGFRTYSIVIQTWLLRPDGVPRAIQLLDEMWNAQVSTSNTRLKPDSLSLHCIIVGFCRANQPEVAQKLLMKVCELKRNSPASMIEPKPASFGSVLGALLRSKHANAARIAHQLVTHMEELHNRGVIGHGPDVQMYRTLIGLWAQSDHSGAAKIALQIVLDMRERALKGDKLMQPDLMTYNQVIFALSRGNGKAEPLRAERLLRLMHDDSTKLGSSVKPDIRSFNSVLAAWARYHHPHSLDRAFELFQTMERLHQGGEPVLDAVSCNVMLHALAKSPKRQSAERAESVLLRMHALTNGGNEAFRPDAASYGCVVTAWVHANDPGRATDVLSDMCTKFANGQLDMKPQVRLFEQVASALASSNNASNEKYNAIMALKSGMYPVESACQVSS